MLGDTGSTDPRCCLPYQSAGDKRCFIFERARSVSTQTSVCSRPDQSSSTTRYVLIARFPFSYFFLPITITPHAFVVSAFCFPQTRRPRPASRTLGAPQFSGRSERSPHALAAPKAAVRGDGGESPPIPPRRRKGSDRPRPDAFKERPQRRISERNGEERGSKRVQRGGSPAPQPRAAAGGWGQVEREEGECFLPPPPGRPPGPGGSQPAPSELKRLPHAAPPQCRGRSRGGPSAAPRPPQPGPGGTARTAPQRPAAMALPGSRAARDAAAASSVSDGHNSAGSGGGLRAAGGQGGVGVAASLLSSLPLFGFSDNFLNKTPREEAR